MAKRGTRVGQAYIALTVDGDGVNKDIVDAVDDVDYRKMGERHGDEYSEGYFESIGQNIEKGLGDEFREKMKRLTATIDSDMARENKVGLMLSKAVQDGDLDALFDKVGRDAGLGFGEGFDKEVRVSVINSLERTLDKAARSAGSKFDLNAILFEDNGELVFGKFFDEAVKDAEKSLRDARQRQTAAFEKEWKRVYGEEQAWIKANAKFKEDWIKATAQMQRESEKAHQSWAQQVESFNQKQKLAFVKHFNKVQETEEKSRLSWAQQVEAFNQKQKLEFVREYAKRMEAADKDTQKRLDDHAKAELAKEDLIWKVRNASAKAHAQYLGQLSRGTIDQFGNAVSRNSKNEGMLAGLLTGTAFGRGSRMDGLHYFGSMMGLMTRSVVGFAKTTGKVVSTVTGLFTEGFNNAANGANFFTKVLGGMGGVVGGAGKGLSSLAASGPAIAIGLGLAVVAVGAFVLAASVLASVLGALLGIVTMFVGVVSLGIVGALTIATGALLATVAAGGLLAAAFMSLSESQKALLKESFLPLKQEFKDLGRIMADEMSPAFAQWGENVRRALSMVTPLASVMGVAFARAGTAITASLSGPGFQNFVRALQIHLPGIVQNLSVAFGRFLNGLTGMFAAIMPSVDRFALYLAEVTERFSEWANSAEGQNSIENFMVKAEAALKSTWEVLTEFGGLLKDILFNNDTQGQGVAMFDGIADAVRRMRDRVKEMTKNGDLKKWLKDARKFGGDLWATIESLAGTFQALYDDGTLTAVGDGLRELSSAIKAINRVAEPVLGFLGDALPVALDAALGPVDDLIAGVKSLVDNLDVALGLLSKVPGGGYLNKIIGAGKSAAAVISVPSGANARAGEGLAAIPPAARASMNRVVNNTRSGAGRSGSAPAPVSWNDLETPVSNYANSGGGSAPEKAEWVNPWVKWAKSLINEGPGIAKQLRQAMKRLNNEVRNAIKDSTRATDVAEARGMIDNMVASVRQTSRDGVQRARDALNSAARDLASASTPAEAKKAMKDVERQQKNLAKAQAAQRKANKAAALLNKQKITTPQNVARLLDGLKVQGATLADFAAAREKVVERLAAANLKLEEAIALRDGFFTQVSDSVRAFGSLLTAQGQIVDGVEQSVTATDMIGNMRDRLAQVQKFQSDLRQLLALGLSDAAYKQLLEGGVEQGGAYASALLQGGSGAINEINSLTSSMDSIATQLGLEASNHLYQAGVDAAQGLVDGLESLAAELDSAAAKLGESIAKAVKRALGIKSPSRVLRADMQHVGDGVVLGLQDQHRKVEAAASSLAGLLSLNPSVDIAARANGTNPDEVSGNSGKVEHHWHIVTPTEDPHAVAQEVLNEVVGRL